jgi:hypothetical protein
MAALVSTPTQRTIRVYCPTHKVGFSTVASASIECSSSTHTLARDFPSESFWEYCCDCQHYWPLDAAKGNRASDECPVCERHIDRRALCSECKVVSVESNDAGKRKAFFISSQTMTKPACPGCLRQSNQAVLEHTCPDFDSVFVTTRDVCPFCDQRLEPPPNFPCPVKSYIEKLPHSAVAGGFDPESGLLKEAPAGQYFLIPIARESSLSIVIPSSARLSSRQDYYNSYYELFNCENPVAGEVIILSPAIVEGVEGGWRLRETGLIEIMPDPELAPGPATITCANCGQLGNTEHTFCKRCGARIKSGSSHEQAEEFSTPDPPSVEQATEVFGVPDYPPPHQVSAPVAGYTGPPTKTILGVVGGIALIGLVLTIIVVSSKNNPDIETKLDKAIATGQVFSPATDNAHDLYDQLKNSGATEEKLRPYRERLLPLLTDRNLRMIRDFMVPGSDDPPLSDWQSAYQSLHWAVELKPGDSSLLARSLYCEGRLAFLSKDEDRAIAVWTRAADADKSWPLPVNGIGLIYTARKNYPAARTYYFEALHRDASWAYPYNNIGTSHYMEKNFYEAKDYYQKAIQLAPEWARPHSWLGDIAMREKDYNTAIQEFSLVLEPSATGTKNMDLDKIRRQLELAKQKAEVF